MNVLSMSRVSWARLVSDLLSPPIVLTLTACFLAGGEADSASQAALLAGSFIVFSVLIPFSILAWWVYRGTVSDFHMSERNQRYWPLALSFGCSLLSWAAVRWMGGTVGMNLLTSFFVLVNLIGLGVTFYWQISIHTGIITGCITTIGIALGPQTGLMLMPLIVLVGAARLKLRKHTLAQVIAGGLVGAGTVLMLHAVQSTTIG
jgi:membrane-associated phospholipid phosphatase